MLKESNTEIVSGWMGCSISSVRATSSLIILHSSWVLSIGLCPNGIYKSECRAMVSFSRRSVSNTPNREKELSKNFHFIRISELQTIENEWLREEHLLLAYNLLHGGIISSKFRTKLSSSFPPFSFTCVLIKQFWVDFMRFHFKRFFISPTISMRNGNGKYICRVNA